MSMLNQTDGYKVNHDIYPSVVATAHAVPTIPVERLENIGFRGANIRPDSGDWKAGLQMFAELFPDTQMSIHINGVIVTGTARELMEKADAIEQVTKESLCHNATQK